MSFEVSRLYESRLDICIETIYLNRYNLRMELRGMKALFWIASSRKDLKAMPNDVQDIFGFALYQAPKPDMNIIHDRFKAAELHAKGEQRC